MASCDALAIPEINRFKEDVNTTFRQAGKAAIDFGSGLRQRILEIRDSRNDYAYSGVSIANRFPTLSVAENAIAKIREAIRDIYTKLGKQTPAWVKSNAKRTASLSQRQKLVKWERGKYGLRNKVRSDCVHLCRRMETVPEDVIIWV
jgi:hypothetical protein